MLRPVLPIAAIHVKRGQRVAVAVDRLQAEAVIDLDGVAEGTLAAHVADPSARGGDDRRAALGGDVDPAVHLGLAREGRYAPSVAGGQPALGGPDRRRGGEPVALATQLLDQVFEGALAQLGCRQQPARVGVEIVIPGPVLVLVGLAHGGADAVGLRPRQAFGHDRALFLVAAAHPVGHRALGLAGRAGQVRDHPHLALELVQARKALVERGHLLGERLDLLALLGGLLAQRHELGRVAAHADPVHDHCQQDQGHEARAKRAALQQLSRDLVPSHRRRVIAEDHHGVFLHAHSQRRPAQSRRLTCS